MHDWTTLDISKHWCRMFGLPETEADDICADAELQLLEELGHIPSMGTKVAKDYRAWNAVRDCARKVASERRKTKQLPCCEEIGIKQRPRQSAVFERAEDQPLTDLQQKLLQGIMSNAPTETSECLMYIESSQTKNNNEHQAHSRRIAKLRDLGSKLLRELRDRMPGLLTAGVFLAWAVEVFAHQN